jgi:hypothetical protein
VKGVILQINPAIRIVDISHDIAPFSISQGAYVIASAYPYFPKGSIHLVVVDPGVGSARRSILAVSRSGFFLAPDNGVLSYILKEDGPCQIYELTEKKFFLDSSGRTFHGRDIFAPVAAWLSTGLESGSFGSPVSDPVTFPVRTPETHENRIKGQILYVDHYGNLISNIRLSDFPGIDLKAATVNIGKRRLSGGKRFYAEVEKGALSFLFNSSGSLEIFKREGNAADDLNIRNFEELTLELGK